MLKDYKILIWAKASTRTVYRCISDNKIPAIRLGTRTYPTDLKYTEWILIIDFFPSYRLGRPRKWEMWQILNAILYAVRTGCQWRMLPTNLPPWWTVYGYFWRWKRQGLWERINELLVQKVRTQAGRQPKPSAAIIDTQSVKTSEGGEQRGVDVHK